MKKISRLAEVRGARHMGGGKLVSGLIVRAQSGFFDVETERGVVQARIRGRHRRRRLEGDLVALGDRVKIRLLEGGTAVIEEIQERERALSRRAPGQDREQILVANPDQAVFIFACADPDPNFRMLDRLLVSAEEQGLPALICANKIDLVRPADARHEFGEYQRIGYPIHYTSAKTGKGIAKLLRALRHRISVFAGPSGGGKSSILNAIQPDLRLPIGEISGATGRGRHTTVFPALLKLTGGGYVADTPGLKAFALWDIEAGELDGYFPEFRNLVSHCAFSDCTHMHEPACAIKEAVERGKISPERYDSYLRIRLGEQE